MAITTAMAVSFKTELLGATHCFQATPGSAPTANATSASATLSTVSSLAGVVTGMVVNGTGIPLNTTLVVAMPAVNQITMSANATATNTGITLSFIGDTFKMALIKAGMGGTYGATTTNYSAVTGASDEVANGNGYTTGGFALTNVSPTSDNASIAWTTFSPNPSWTAATFSTAGCIIYSTSLRNAGVTGRAVSVHDFGGTQSVSAGVLTVLLPAATNSTALLRLS